MNMDKITLGFRVVLLITTGVLVVYCVSKYVQNKSTASVDFKTYHETDKDQYPSISMCFSDSVFTIYDGEKLRKTYGIDKYYAKINDYVDLVGWEYLQFLSGDIWDETMVNVNYDYVTQRINDLFHDLVLATDDLGLEPVFRWVNHAIQGSQPQDVNHNDANSPESFPFLTSQRTAFTKCLTFDVPTSIIPKSKGKILRLFKLSFNVSSSRGLGLGVFFHYPGQLSRAVPVDYEIGKNMGLLSGEIWIKDIFVSMVEGIRRRHNSKESCNLESQRTDELLYKKMAEKLNCKPSHWIDVEYPVTCNNSESMKLSNFADTTFYDPKLLKMIRPPCDQIEVANVAVKDLIRSKFEDDEDMNPQLAHLTITFTSALYKEITHEQDYDLEGLIGNGGGYVGLFLGFAIWQIPDFCYMIFGWLSKTIIHIS